MTDFTDPHGFETSEFNSPSAAYRPVYTWVWNAPVTEEIIDGQLDSMLSLGIDAFYILPEPNRFRPTFMSTAMRPEYLSDEFFTLVKYTVEAAKKRSMTMWLYDEGGWPSGNACGEVVREHPEYRRKKLVREMAEAGVALDGEDIVAAFSEDKTRLSLPYTPREGENIAVYRAVYTAGADLLCEDAVKRFISLTHEGYKRAVGSVKDAFVCTFTDEPSVIYPACLRDPEAFKARFGYDYADRLPELFSGGASSFKRDFCDFYSSEAARVYYGALREWCSENGVLSAGHLNGDDDPFAFRQHGGQLLRQLRMLDVPGVDVIWRQIFPGSGRSDLFPRFASSAAAQTGHSRSLSESFAVYGASLDFTQISYVLLAQAARGINVFNFMLFSQGNDLFEASQERPCFRPELPGSRFLPAVNDFAARLAYVSSIGRPANHAALYYPINAVWEGGDCSRTVGSFDRIARGLEAMYDNFDIVDDDFLRSAINKNGRLSGGLACYDTVYIPEEPAMPEDVRLLLLEFERRGGKIFYDIAISAPCLAVRPLIRSLRVSKRIAPDGDSVYIIYNESDSPAEAAVTFDEAQPAYELDLYTGEIFPAERVLALKLDSGEGKVFLFTSKILCVSERAVGGEEFFSSDDFSARRISRFSVGAEGISSVPVEEAAVHADNGSFAELFGADFSGEAVFETQLPERSCASLLTLEGIDIPCEVFAGDSSLGIRLRAPYAFTLPAGGECTLRVLAANTAAPAYAAFDAKNAFSTAEIGPYHERTLEYESSAPDVVVKLRASIKRL